MAITLTPADRVTLARTILGAGCAVLVLITFAGLLEVRNWPLFLLAVPTTVLDAVDGPVARRTGTATRRGARFDMEADAAVLLMLSVAVAPVAPWALGIGTMHYLFWAGARMRPHWAAPLPFRQSRRVIAAVQAVALVIALAPFVPVPTAQVVITAALALLVFSFGRDIVFQERIASR